MVVQNDQERVFLTIRFPLLDQMGAIEAVCAMSTDITERHVEQQARQERLRCSEQIHAALAHDRFVLHGQPIVNVASLEVEQSELLIRMRDAGGGEELAAPCEFLACAERFDLIQLVDKWVVSRALELAAAGRRVEVNLSAKTICDQARVGWIEHTILASSAPTQNLIFEITETAAAEIQFVRNLCNDEDDQQVVRAIVGVAKQFGIKTIAEGVEDEATLKELRRMGVDYAQGYYIGRPVSFPPAT